MKSFKFVFGGFPFKFKFDKIIKIAFSYGGIAPFPPRQNYFIFFNISCLI